MKNTMRNTLLVTVAAAALIAGAGLASAQGTGETVKRRAQPPMSRKPRAARWTSTRALPPQKSPAPNAQAPMKPAPTAQAPAKETRRQPHRRP